jgi:asparagine synthase (glutamine-hydrolysing)
LLESSVIKRLQSDRPVGFFLSGGLDSSLIASIGARYFASYGKKIQTFSIGIGDSPDLKYAKKVAEFLQSNHTEVRFTADDGINALKDVIRSLETYDCTTIRASVPMYLLSKYVSDNTNIKVILSGEGADELFGGYLYMRYAPSPADFQSESINLIYNVHKHDVLRADRSTAAHGLELRVPFFDRTLISYVTSLLPEIKMATNRMEKYILRESFSEYLPDDVLWRQKNGMSDAVGSTWIDSIKKYASTITCSNVYGKNKPLSNEEYLYRELYHSLFDHHDNVSHIWRPKWTIHSDPSGALLSHFNDN